MDTENMKKSDFYYELPQELIAQTPVEPRNASRLMCIDRTNGSISHCHFYNLCDILQKGDLIVMNDSRESAPLTIKVDPVKFKALKISGSKLADMERGNDISFDGSRILSFGIPVRAEFAAEESRAEARRKLGWEENQFVMLLSGGSIGAGKIAASIAALRPFLKEDRRAKLDRALEIARVTRLIRVALGAMGGKGEGGGV